VNHPVYTPTHIIIIIFIINCPPRSYRLGFSPPSSAVRARPFYFFLFFFGVIYYYISPAKPSSPLTAVTTTCVHISYIMRVPCTPNLFGIPSRRVAAAWQMKRVTRTASVLAHIFTADCRPLTLYMLFFFFFTFSILIRAEGKAAYI